MSNCRWTLCRKGRPWSFFTTVFPKPLGLGARERVSAVASKAFGMAAVLALMVTGTASSHADGLVVTPTDEFSVSGFPRGPLGTVERVYTISNSSPSTLNWSVGKNQDWVSLSSAGGSIAPGATDTVRVRVNNQAFTLAPGSQLAFISFIDLGNLDLEVRNVALNILNPGPGSATIQSVPVDNTYRLTVTGVPGTTFVLENADTPESTANWSPIFTNTFSSSTETFDFSTATDPQKYFRSISSGAGAVAATLSVAKVEALDNSLVEVTADPDATYIVEASTNGMASWVGVYTNKVPASGSFTFQNTVTDTSGTVDYRVVPVNTLDVPVLNHVLIVGESLALGFDGTPSLSTTPMGDNKRFASSGGNTLFAPLRELNSETIASSAANSVLSADSSHPMMFSNIGQNGAKYDVQEKGTALFDSGIAQFEDGALGATCNNFNYRARALFVVGGEGDQLNPNYDLNIRQWQADYEDEVQLLEGTSDQVPMFHSQISAWTSPNGGLFETVTSPYLVLAESEANPGLTVLVGPRYFLPHAGPGAAFPGLHLTNEGYRWLGEYYAKAYKAVVVDGGSWAPLKPSSVTRNGAVITAVFDVPAPPLVLDTTAVTDPGNFGFEFHDDSGAPPAISSVTLTGPDTVEITLDAAPTGGDQRLRYAYTGVIGNSGGPTDGARGNLRDSDATTSIHGNDLFNWCVHFDAPVN